MTDPKHRRPEQGRQQRPALRSVQTEEAWTLTGPPPVLVPPGEYLATVTGHEIMRTRFGDKLVLRFTLDDGPLPNTAASNEPPAEGYDEPRGVELLCFHNVTRRAGRIHVASCSKYARHRSLVTGKRPRRFDRPDPGVFVGQFFRVLVVTVTDDGNHPLPPAGYYSVVEKILDRID